MNINSLQVVSDVKQALFEDVGAEDVTAALLPSHLVVAAEIISREPMLVCGQPWVNEVVKQVDDKIEIEWLVSEGDWLSAPTTLCILHGTASSILTAERTALNFLQTLSATATQTYHYTQKLKDSQTRLLDTRKTIPGLRMAQKYAVRCGGGVNHRMGLYDAFLIKENHIKACGSIARAIALARQTHKHLLVEIEVENLVELREAFDAHPDRILLDNFSQSMLEQAVKMNQPKYCELEASGGINIDNIAEVAKSGVDFISVGAITKSIKAIDLSLLVREVL
ncbi:carboxylating nicotinate-nucleotide diphosphorylase [Legionella maioricensis]|uniref:nicotinate-nucleotide diphosphorylase (carboxylating) n=1 Tax=Legionella maioricensis TaxID=2896528 RepID=A0A9X2IBL4_9GAMM|nr:carboxylating nicotinate-nucleotide diphosphorylase [Legionella maioricensis]MCL9683512.1 carboxylating nicotinate-nucleotide diphosphorylase [Legionella maioricensis]MCL9686811.1 carboxylating nicotinate-nucleotide diphosphorylase [Legionella maioricensis]